MTTSSARHPTVGWFGAFEGRELLQCAVSQETRRVTLWIGLGLALALSDLILLAFVNAQPRSRTVNGLQTLQVMTVTVTLGMWSLLALQVPYALRWVTAEDDLPLAMLTGITVGRMWTVRVLGSAWSALLVPLVHLPVLVWCYPLGGLKSVQLLTAGYYWAIAWCFGVGAASVAGCMWAGNSRDRMQGAALVLVVIGLYAAVLIATGATCYRLAPDWGWIVFWTMSPPWRSGLIYWLAPLVHLFSGGLLCLVSRILLRGRWRSEVLGETGSTPVEETVPTKQPDRVIVSAQQPWPKTDDVLPVVLYPTARPRCQLDPFGWKDHYVHGGGAWSMTARWVICVIVSMCLAIWELTVREWEPFLALTWIGWVILFMFEITQPLNWEFRDKMWTTVRILPLSVGEILWAKLKIVGWRILPTMIPVGVMCLVTATFRGGLVGVGFSLLIVSMIVPPLGMLLLYGTAIPQNLLGGGWPLLRTVGVLVALAVLYFMALCSANGFVIVIGSIIFSLVSTAWLTRATLLELDQPRRELFSETGE